MKKSLFYILACIMAFSCEAQQYEISGYVQTTAGIRLHQTTVTLKALSSPGKEQVATTDINGLYNFASLQPGIYKLTASYSGYQSKSSDSIVLNQTNTAANYVFSLTPATQQMEEVRVTSSISPVQVEAGKITFNLQNQAVTAGQTAFDVLKKLPGVSIDQNENILLRGTAGVNVMVDGKMTYLSGSQLSNYLKGLSAEDISRIELINTPGSAFDAAGNSGIIQIITRKKKNPGYAVDIRTVATWSKSWLWNENISGSLRTKKWNLFGSFDFNTPHRYYDKSSGNTLPGSADSLRLHRTQETVFKIKYYTYRAGADWQLHPSHQLSFRYHGYFDDWAGTHYTRANTINTATNKLSSYIRSVNRLVEPYHYDATGLSYRFSLDTLGKKITADADVTSYKNYSDGLLVTQNYTQSGIFVDEEQLQVHQPGFIKIQSIKLDTELPFKKFTIAGGLKWALVENDNEYNFDSLRNGQFIPAETMSDHFKYKEKIAAAYVSAAKKWRQSHITVGLRWEHTDAHGFTESGNSSNYWKYSQLFPSAAFTQQVGTDHEISVSLSRRINRPNYGDLNPVRWYSDQYFYYSGNPELSPELAWIYAGTYSFQKKYILSASFNRSSNFINRLLVPDGASIKSMSANLGNQQRLDVNLSIPIKPAACWSIQLFTGIAYTNYPISMKSGLKSLSLWSNVTTIQQSFTLPKGWEATLNGNYYSSELRGIYKTTATGFIDAGIKKKFFKNKLTGQFNCNDIFNINRYKAFSQTDVIDYFYNDKQYTRQVSLSLTYHIGGTVFKAANRKTDEQQRL